MLKLGKHQKEQTKMPRFRLEKSTTVHNLLFCAHTLCMNYVTNKFLLVSSSVRVVHGQGQKREQKRTTEKFVGFHNHSPLLTMVTLEHHICFALVVR